jgi:hypothetical protein
MAISPSSFENTDYIEMHSVIAHAIKIPRRSAFGTVELVGSEDGAWCILVSREASGIVGRWIQPRRVKVKLRDAE